MLSKSVVRLTDRPDITSDIYRGRITTIQQYNITSNRINLLQIKSLLNSNAKNSLSNPVS